MTELGGSAPARIPRSERPRIAGILKAENAAYWIGPVQTLAQGFPTLSADEMTDVLTGVFKQYEEDELREILKSAPASFAGTLDVIKS